MEEPKAYGNNKKKEDPFIARGAPGGGRRARYYPYKIFVIFETRAFVCRTVPLRTCQSLISMLSYFLTGFTGFMSKFTKGI